jgi:hypothetical protein
MTNLKLSLLDTAATLSLRGSAPSFAADVRMLHVCTRKLRLVLRVLLLVWAAWPLAAQAQFTQQGPKLAGTGAIAPYGGASGPEQGFSVSLSGDGNTGILGGIFDNNAAGAAWVFTRLNGVWIGAPHHRLHPSMQPPATHP